MKRGGSDKNVDGGASLIDLAAFARADLATDPFPYVIVPGFLPEAARSAISADYPKVDRPGSFSAGELDYGPAFARFLAEIEGEAMRDAFARKFSVDLSGKPTMVTVRGQARMGDGQIHTDTRSKIITVLIYMNEAWEAPGGRLRLLRSNKGLDDMVAEVPPAAGTLLAFLVTPHSWHGHHPASGPRRVIQLNWVESQGVVWRERFRHGLSARIKKLFPARA